MQQSGFSVQARVDAQPQGRQLGGAEGEPRARAVVAELGHGRPQRGNDGFFHERHLQHDEKKKKKKKCKFFSQPRDEITMIYTQYVRIQIIWILKAAACEAGAYLIAGSVRVQIPHRKHVLR